MMGAEKCKLFLRHLGGLKVANSVGSKANPQLERLSLGLQPLSLLHTHSMKLNGEDYF